jgi:hypothetical protein
MSTAPKANRTTTDRHACEEMSRGTTWHRRACGNTARFYEKKWGKEQWFCAMHAPSEKKRRSDERHEAKVKLLRPRWEAEAKQHRIELAGPELLAALKRLKARIEELSAVKREGVTGAAYDVMTASIGDDITAEFIEAEEAIAKAEGRE